MQAMVMNVKMCCAKCEEKAKEECEEVEGASMGSQKALLLTCYG